MVQPQPEQDDARPVRLPPRVTRVATDLQLGQVVLTQRRHRGFADTVTLLILALVSVVVMVVAAAVRLRALGVFGLLLLVGVTILAVYRAIGGARSAYLFDHGLVATHNGRASGVTWEEVKELWLWRAGGRTALNGALLGYYVITKDGRKIGVTAGPGDGDPFGERLVAAIRATGCPVTDSGPYTGRLRP